MKGLGRNIKYASGILLTLPLLMYLMGILILVLLSLGEEDIVTSLIQVLPLGLLYITPILILIAVGYAEMFCRHMVFLGSARKSAAFAVIISVQVFLLLQLVLFFALSLLAKNSFVTEVVWSCPLGIIALCLAIIGIGLWIDSLSLSGHYVMAGVFGFLWALIGVGLIGGVSAHLTTEKNVELLVACNSIWLLVAGLAVDLIGTLLYYKTVIKADLKLA